MAFDKKNAMRNAERYLSQGKTRSAINEYKQVVRHDSRDFVTLNILGDLYVKDNDESSAVKCYNAVAEHYSKQGFAAKAIAVYKKINRIRPNIPEINEKLAGLYRERGAYADAKSHYESLAKHYETIGRKGEALEIWKQVAEIDPNNTDVYNNIAESYLREGNKAEAAEAYTLLGKRLENLGRPAAAVDAFQRTLEIDRSNHAAVSGLVSAYASLGRDDDGDALLKELVSEMPQDRDLARLQIENFLRTKRPAEAEAALLKLAEVEPANVDKFLDLAHLYLERGGAESAARVLNVSSDHFLASGNIDDYRDAIQALLETDPDNLESLRLQIGLCTWLRDETAYLDSLKRLAECARNKGSVEDEHFALSQIVMVAPQESAYSSRFRELNEKHGFETESYGESLFDKQFIGRNSSPGLSGPLVGSEVGSDQFSEKISSNGNVNGNGSNGKLTHNHSPSLLPDADAVFPTLSGGQEPHLVTEVLQEDDEDRLVREIDSIRFYVDNGYIDLAQKAVVELRGDFGSRPEIDELETFIADHSGPNDEVVPQQIEETSDHVTFGAKSAAFSLDELRSELGIDDPAEEDASDYDTHYGTAIAYKEMGLLEEAIKEFQNAAVLVDQNDGSRRFYNCANLLGHCFMQIGKPHLAITWYQRALETPQLGVDEKQGLWYEFANACEANGEIEKASDYFERVYAENIDFRDVAQRIERLAVAA